MTTLARHRLVPLGIGVLLGVVLVVAKVGAGFDLRLLDALQRSVSPPDSSPVVIIDIDADTVSDFGWPISPAIYAVAIQAIHDSGAAAIGVDVLFHDQRLRWLDSENGAGVDPAEAAGGEADAEDVLLGEVSEDTRAVLATYRQVETVTDGRRGSLPKTPPASRGRCSKIKPGAMSAPLRPGLLSVLVGHVHQVPGPDGVRRHMSDCVAVHDGCLRSLVDMMLEPDERASSCEPQLIPYHRSFGDFPRLSMRDLVERYGNEEGEAELETLLGGKYVLVGPSDEGIGDLAATPASPWEPLVAVHGNWLEARLLGRSVGEVSWLLVLALGVAVPFLLFGLPMTARLWLGVGFAAAVAGLLGSFMVFRAAATWVPPSPFVLPVVLGSLSSAGWAGWRHLRFNQMLTQAFGSYVSPDVLDWLQETEGAALDPTAAERRRISVIFSDIAGYTRLSNDLDADGVMRSLRLYLHAMVAVIQRHGGYLDKINGDGLMVLFGAPRRQENGADAAVACALEMQEEVGRLQREWRAVTGKDLRTRVGIATGRAFVGNLGGEGHVEYTAIGPVVNLAARLESKAPIGGLLLCEETHVDLDSSPRGEWVEVELKGYESSGPVRVFAVPPPSNQQ